MRDKTIIIAGPTATRKTELAFEIAKHFPSTIINADSMQVYNDLRLLTNRPSKRKLDKFSCKLFAVLDPPNTSSLGWWAQNAINEINNSIKSRRNPILVGGTGMYLNSLQNEISFIPTLPKRHRRKILEIHQKKGNSFFSNKLRVVDPETHKKINMNDTQRIIRAIEVKVCTGRSLSFWHKKSQLNKTNNNLFVVITENRDQLYKNIDKRFSEMIERNVLNEVEQFLEKKINTDHPIYKTIGLRHLKSYLEGEINLDQAVNMCQKDTRNYAKRQITWFKNQPSNAYYLEYNKARDFILDKLMNQKKKKMKNLMFKKNN